MSIVSCEEGMRAGSGHRLQEVGEGREAGVAGALVVERAITQQRELRAMVCELVHLPVIELDRTDGGCGCEEFLPVRANASVGRCSRVLIEPARDGGGVDRVSKARGDALTCFRERVAAIVEGDGVEDFASGICLVAKCQRPGRKAPAARAAPQDADVFKFVFARTFERHAGAVAMRAAFRCFER